MSNQFTSLIIDFHQRDHASVYYAHLQNIVKQLILNNSQNLQNKQELILTKLDNVLFDVYKQYLTLYKQYFALSTNMKNMLLECTGLMNECKGDKQTIAKITQDRQYILERLKQSTNQSLQIVLQNQKLREQLDKMTEINQLMIQKNGVLQQQIQNVTTTNKSYENVVLVSKQIQKISNDNVSIQNDIAQILKTTQMYGNASQPLQIMCLAFQENPGLREQLWNEVKEKHKNKFDNVQQAKDNFFKFNYIDALMLFTQKK